MAPAVLWVTDSGRNRPGVPKMLQIRNPGGTDSLSNMDKIEHLRQTNRLAELKRLLLQTTDPAALTVINDDIADVETRLRASQSRLDLSQTDPHSG